MEVRDQEAYVIALECEIKIQLANFFLHFKSTTICQLLQDEKASTVLTFIEILDDLAI